MIRLIALLLMAAGGVVRPGQDDSGVLWGVVTLNGEMPKPRTHSIKCEKCSPLYPKGMPFEDLVVGKDREIQWAFVHVNGGLQGKRFEAPPTPKILDQKGCRYQPRVLGIMVGQELVIRNSDPHVHCIHTLGLRNKELVFQQQSEGETRKRFDQPEIMIKLKDDVYVWMNAWLGVLDHPYYAVTGPDGRYEIKGLPPGKYTLEVWHEKCSRVTKDVEIKGTSRSRVDWAVEIRRD